MTLTFACGHKADVSPEVTEPPVCPVCREARVSRVEAPAPRFRGVATGPLCVKG